MQGQKSKEFKISIDGAEKLLYFMRPTLSQIFDMDMEYRKIYAEAIRQGVATEAEIKNRMKKTEAWTEIDQNRISHISLEIARLESVFKATRDGQEDEVAKIIEKIAELRRELISLISQKTSLLTNTAEDIANNQRMYKLVELCCYTDNQRFFDDRQVFESFFQQYPDQASEIFKQSFLYEYDTKEDFTEDWIEVKYFKELLEKEKAKLEQKKEEKQNEQLETVPSNQDEEPKKRGRKKKDN